MIWGYHYFWKHPFGCWEAYVENSNVIEIDFPQLSLLDSPKRGPVALRILTKLLPWRETKYCLAELEPKKTHTHTQNVKMLVPEWCKGASIMCSSPT